MDKSYYRKVCLDRLKAVSTHHKRYLEHKVNTQLLTLCKDVKNSDILLYWALDMEVNLRPLINTLRKRNRLYLPFMEGNSFKMVPLRLPLTRKQFNIYESGNSLRKIKKIDKAIVPVVGVDLKAKRIGFGRGMYDRFFEQLPSSPEIIFTQLTDCIVNKAVCDNYDIKANMLITPTRRYCERRSVNVNRSTLRRCNSRY